MTPHLHGLALLTGLAFVVAPVTAAAQADEVPDEEPEPNALAWPDSARRVQWPEAVAAPVIVAGGFTMLLAGPVPETDARAMTAFDRKLQERLSLGPGRARDVFSKIGNAGYLGTFAYRAVDDLLIAGAIRGGWDVAWQLLVIDTLAFGIVGAVTFGSQLAFGRQRPRYTFCEEARGRDDPRCDPGDRTNRSFISGHHGVAVAGASLTCMHHARMRIYRTQRSGRAACVSHALAATMVGVSRALGDDHWPTDILLGSALGFAAGWVLPRLLHYGFREHGHGHGQWDERDEPATSSRPRLRVAILPSLGPRRAGLGAIGLW